MGILSVSLAHASSCVTPPRGRAVSAPAGTFWRSLRSAHLVVNPKSHGKRGLSTSRTALAFRVVSFMACVGRPYHFGDVCNQSCASVHMPPVHGRSGQASSWLCAERRLAGTRQAPERRMIGERHRNAARIQTRSVPGPESGRFIAGRQHEVCTQESCFDSGAKQRCLNVFVHRRRDMCWPHHVYQDAYSHGKS